MRILTRCLIAAAVLLFVAPSASAYAVSMSPRGATTSLAVSNTVTVDVYLDVGPLEGVSLFSVAVINSNPSALLYDGPASAALPLHPSTTTVGCVFASCSGAQPSYILYSAAPLAYLLPLQTPYFLNFPPETPGTEQVNVNYFEQAIVGTTTATGIGIYVATLVFHVVGSFATESLELAFTSSNLISDGTFLVPPTTIGLSAPIILTGVPEPTTAMLIGLGLVGLGLAGRRQA